MHVVQRVHTIRAPSSSSEVYRRIHFARMHRVCLGAHAYHDAARTRGRFAYEPGHYTVKGEIGAGAANENVCGHRDRNVYAAFRRPPLSRAELRLDGVARSETRPIRNRSANCRVDSVHGRRAPYVFVSFVLKSLDQLI